MNLLTNPARDQADRPEPMVRHLTHRATNWHRQGELPSIALMSAPRSGSTWLMEIINTQPRFKAYNEPFNLRNPDVVAHLGVHSWADLYSDEHVDRIRTYLVGMRDGRLRFMDHRPLVEHHRWRTDRIVFKILHGLEHRVDLLRSLGFAVLHLTRHPVPVALSRHALPRLETLVSEPYLAHFTPEVRKVARRVFASGVEFECAVLAWCLEHKPLLDDGATLVTYEQLVVDPDPVIDLIADTFALPSPERMRARLERPSGSYAPVDGRRLAVLRDGAGDRTELVSRWTERVDERTVRAAWQIVEEFEIDLYRPDRVMPTKLVGESLTSPS